jgi:hypothetical protein
VGLDFVPAQGFAIDIVRAVVGHNHVELAVTYTALIVDVFVVDDPDSVYENWIGEIDFKPGRGSAIQYGVSQ